MELKVFPGAGFWIVYVFRLGPQAYALTGTRTRQTAIATARTGANNLIEHLQSFMFLSPFPLRPYGWADSSGGCNAWCFVLGFSLIDDVEQIDDFSLGVFLQVDVHSTRW